MCRPSYAPGPRTSTTTAPSSISALASSTSTWRTSNVSRPGSSTTIASASARPATHIMKSGLPVFVVVAMSVLLPFVDPRHRRLAAPGRELADLRGDEMRCQLLGDAAERRIGDERDLADVPVVVLHEPHVRHQRAEALPARERRHLDHEAGEVADGLDVRVDDRGERLEVLGGER